jgi:tetratricopeptide (TPR) repeat protein
MQELLVRFYKIIAEKLKINPHMGVISDVRKAVEADPELIALLQPDRSVHQDNKDNTKAFQAIIEGGVAYIGDHYHFHDIERLRNIFEDILNIYVSTLGSLPSNKDSEKTVRRPDISVSRLPVVGQNIFGRERELDLLSNIWESAHVNIVSLVAWGGVGKSTLVTHWLRRLVEDQYHGAERVYAWSFYSQGTSNHPISADEFVDWALQKFGASESAMGSSWAKGQRLAQLIQSQRVLLVLDGLEPLQFPPGMREGTLRDPALHALLCELAVYNPGLCVITTRFPVTDLDCFEGHTLNRIDLNELSPKSGAQLLASLGVRGYPEQLEAATTEFKGHALALTLLGSYLTDAYDGDIRRRDVIGPLEADERHGGHARRVMASYERWFGEGAELQVLRLLGLFNRPAENEAISALLCVPAIAHLTDKLQNFTKASWQRTLSKLRRARLLAPQNPEHPDELDTHPLVREHFGYQVEKSYSLAWQEGNNRLYEHLMKTSVMFPKTLQEVSPLFAAVAHGCRARRYSEALNEVYRKRIQWGEKNSYTTHVLGAINAEVVALANFFEEPWCRPISVLSEEDKAFVLNEVGFDLRAQGRLVEALQAIRVGTELRVAQECWVDASVNFGNLAEIHLMMGDINKAFTEAKQSVELADLSGDAFRRLDMRAGLGEVLHKLGRFEEAEVAFRDAEAIQKEDQPQYPILYSMSGFRYCALLLDQGNYAEVIKRAEQTMAWLKSANLIFAVSMDQLSLGRAYSIQASKSKSDDFSQALDHLDMAVEGLTQSGRYDCVPTGLIVRAEVNMLRKDFGWAKADLEEAMRLSERVGHTISLVDSNLALTRLNIMLCDPIKAQACLDVAEKLISKTEYHSPAQKLRSLHDDLKKLGH